MRQPLRPELRVQAKAALRRLDEAGLKGMPLNTPDVLTLMTVVEAAVLHDALWEQEKDEESS